MNLLLWSKHNLRHIPPYIGRYLSMVLYGKRSAIGPSYQKRRKYIEQYVKLDSKAKQKFVYERIKKVFDFSVMNIPFYQKYYSGKGFHPSKLRHFESLQEIPVLSKTNLNLIELEFRSAISPIVILPIQEARRRYRLVFIQSSFM